MSLHGAEILATATSGAIIGAIGAAASQDSRHPILTGALVSGTLIGALAITIDLVQERRKFEAANPGVSGFQNPRFP
jgi:hypothetical protein